MKRSPLRVFSTFKLFLPGIICSVPRRLVDGSPQCPTNWCVVSIIAIIHIYIYIYIFLSTTHKNTRFSNYYYYVILMSSRINNSSSFLTKRPLTRNRLSAKFFRTSYLTPCVHTRCFRFSINRSNLALRLSGE